MDYILFHDDSFNIVFLLGASVIILSIFNYNEPYVLHESVAYDRVGTDDDGIAISVDGKDLAGEQELLPFARDTPAVQLGSLS